MVVNCTRDIPFSFKHTKHLRLAVHDADEEIDRLFELWKTAIPLIARQIDAGKTVLTHCMAGQQRSAATCAAYLMFKYGWTAKKAMPFIKKKKDDCFWPRAHFKKSLLMWESYLKKKGRVLKD